MAYDKNTRLNTKEMQLDGMMICTNENCGKSIDEPLELFDSAIACPHCGCLLKHKFVVNEQNDDLFRLSQAYYFRYLSAAANNEGESDAKKKAAVEKDLQNAVACCRVAARSGHPEACVKLGFYWEAGYVRKRDSIDRFKMAYRYYDEVSRLDERTVQVELSESGDATARDYADPQKLSKVKKEAAARFLKMLADVGEELENIMGFDLVSLTKRLKNVAGDYDAPVFTVGKTSREEFILRTLREAKANGNDAPVFGYFLMTASALRKAYGDENSKDKIRSLIEGNGKLEMKWVEWSNLDDSDANNNGFTDINDNADCLPKESAGEETVLVYFFNAAWKPVPPKEVDKKKTKKLQKIALLLFNDDEPTEAFHELCKTAKTEFARIFYADDLYYGCLKDGKDPVNGLTEYIAQKRGEVDN